MFEVAFAELAFAKDGGNAIRALVLKKQAPVDLEINKTKLVELGQVFS